MGSYNGDGCMNYLVYTSQISLLRYLINMYRKAALSCFQNISVPDSEKNRKKFYKIFKSNRLRWLAWLTFFFYGLILLWLDNNNWVMQNTIQKFRQNSIVFEKIKTLTTSNYPTVHYFLLKLCTRFLLTNVYKRVCGMFLILFRSWIICKNLRRLVSTHSFFRFLLIT